jgi:ABC-type nitrate/sulfonate/bicarbonate transport system substrate-binding protein
MYGHLEGTETKFARDPSGYLSLENGIYRKHGLDVSWSHVQGTEERYRRLESGEADISFVVGRASLQHFLASRSTRLLGCAMNSCSYYLVAAAGLNALKDLKGKTVACREGPARGVPFTQVFQECAGLKLGKELTLRLPDSDQEAFHLLMGGQVQAAVLPRPYGFMAEEKGFKRMADWPGVVDDPLPISIETTAALVKAKEQEIAAFLEAHREGIRYLKANRGETTRILEAKFGHSDFLAAKTWDDYLICMDAGLKVEFKHLDKLVAQVAPNTPGGSRQVAADWLIPGSLKD